MSFISQFKHQVQTPTWDVGHTPKTLTGTANNGVQSRNGSSRTALKNWKRDSGDVVVSVCFNSSCRPGS